MIAELRLLKKHCKDHDCPKSIYCLDPSCEEAVCPECFLEDHKGHERMKVKELYEDVKKKIDAATNSLKQKQNEYTLREKFTAEEIKKVRAREADQKVKINTFTSELIRGVEA